MGDPQAGARPLSPGLAAALDFSQAFLTVTLTSLTAVMVTQQGYLWPPLPALVLIVLGSCLSGVRAVRTFYHLPTITPTSP